MILVKLNQTTEKGWTKSIFLLSRPHLHARGPHNFLSRAAFNSKNKRARGPQFADPWPKT